MLSASATAKPDIDVRDDRIKKKKSKYSWSVTKCQKQKNCLLFWLLTFLVMKGFPKDQHVRTSCLSSRKNSQLSDQDAEDVLLTGCSYCSCVCLEVISTTENLNKAWICCEVCLKVKVPAAWLAHQVTVWWLVFNQVSPLTLPLTLLYDWDIYPCHPYNFTRASVSH